MILVFFSLLFGWDQFHPDRLYREIKNETTCVPIELNQQRFHLIGKGSQFFAFESEDHTLVLKLFKAKHHLNRFSKRLQLFFSPELQQKSAQSWKKKFAETCCCYELAFQELHEETGLMALHFNETAQADLHVILVDEKKQYFVDLNQIPFVLQKKAVLLPQYLQQLPKEEQLKAIEKVKTLFKQRAKKNITDKRQSLRINYGFIEGKAVQIDPGKIYKNEQLDLIAETEKLNSRVDRWVRKHFPTLQ